MHPRSLWNSGDICWRCQWRLRSARSHARRIQTPKSGLIKASRPPQRAFHLTTARLQQLAAASPTTTPTTPTSDPALLPRPPQLPLRDYLIQWQQVHGQPSEETLSAFENHPANRDIQNGMSKLSSAFQSDGPVDAEDYTAMDENEGEELITIGLFLKPGDVVEVSQPNREPVLAVFVQQLDSDSQFFSVDGRWCHSTIARVAFAITGCIDPVLLKPLLPFMPTSPGKADPRGEVHVPVNLAAPVKNILKRMTEDAERIYRTNAPVLDTAYDVLADAKRTRMMTLSQIAKTLLAQNDPTWKSSPAALLAVRKSLHHNEFRFRSDIRSHRLTNVFAIRPKNDVEVVETVHEWIREHRELLAAASTKPNLFFKRRSKGATFVLDFLEKARRLIALSRKDREPHMGVLGPSKTRSPQSGESTAVRLVWGETFSSTDKQIINFLQAWVLTDQYVGISGLHAACASLIMSTGCYGISAIRSDGLSDGEASQIRRATGMVFLQEIGVITPYENRALYDEQLMLPTVKLSRNLEVLNAKAEVTRKNPDFRDSMADLRREWGPTTVYCIDDVGAQEIDDGISIERINGDTSEFWIHVHVANPTAFFAKTHTLSGLAAHMTETVYTPERSFPMLPSWAAQGYFSLARDRPVLTFSSRIDAGGNTLERKIQPGIVQNIVTMTPSDVASLLGDKPTDEFRRFVVGGDLPVNQISRKAPSVSAEQLQDLRDLYTAAQRLWERRKANGGLRINSTANHVRVFENPRQSGITWNAPSTDRSRLIKGDPLIEVTTRIPRGLIHYGISPTNIVEEMMMLACSTAASWCTERKIPVMYRGTIAPPSSDALSSEEIKAQYVLPYIEKFGDVPYGTAVRYIASLGRAITHSTPLSHKMIGVPGYVKVTSPLRRFSDMIAHWQIEAAIRYEAQTGKKFDADISSTSTRGILPFTQRQMQDSIVTLSPRERIIGSAKKNSTRFWSIMALFRAFYYREAALPDTFRFWVRRAPKDARPQLESAIGLLPDYGYDAFLSNPSNVQVGDEWEVQIERIDVFARCVYVRPLRLLRREEEQL